MTVMCMFLFVPVGFDDCFGSRFYILRVKLRIYGKVNEKYICDKRGVSDI